MGSRILSLLGFLAVVTTTFLAFSQPNLFEERMIDSFKKEALLLGSDQIEKIRDSAKLAVIEHCQHSPSGGSSKVRFAAVDIAAELGLATKIDETIVPRVERALLAIPCPTAPENPDCRRAECVPEADNGWNQYFDEVLGLSANADFSKLTAAKGFSPVKISWEDIGRYKNSVWGDRISDVGIWVRRKENDPDSAELALSVRRDANYSDKILVVPSENIKIHTNDGKSVREVSLPQRLKELGLESLERDRNVIVSNQFAVVPVPSKRMDQNENSAVPPRVAFNFSIFPYGSTNFVITDVIEGSSEAIVGPGSHQLLFANVNGQKAPFTASRAAERSDLLELEKDLKSKGMDVDVQRYYLIQVPLKRNSPAVVLSNMGIPPFRNLVSTALLEGVSDSAIAAAPIAQNKMGAPRGLEKVAIGHGEVEGVYQSGSGFRGQRADEPIRVTVVYFVTPVGKVTKTDMESFNESFEAWDNKSLWGGSLVTKN